MPIIKSAIKRMKQTIKRRDRNVAVKRSVKGAVKTFLAEPTSENLSQAQSKIDTAVKKKLITKNTAARRKANLAKAAKAANAKPAAAKKTTAKAAKSTKAAPAKKATTKAAAKK